MKDITDYFDAGGTVQELVQRANASPIYNSAGETQTGLILTPMNTVRRTPVQWLWPNRLAMGKLNLFFGDPDVGKSTMALYLMAQVSRGGAWPDVPDTHAPIGTSLVLSLEDGLGDTLGPGLDAAGADSSKIIAVSALRFMDANGKLCQRAITLDMVEYFADAVRRCPDARLVVIDPPSSCLPEGVNENSNAAVRTLLSAWGKLAEDTGVCVLFITHRPKASAAKAVHGAMGSLAWLAAARAAWMFARDRDDPQRRLMLRAKCNLAPAVANLAYRIIGPTAHIEWMGEVQTSADDVAKADANPGKVERKSEKLQEAIDWLGEELADGKEYEAALLRERAQEAGLAWRTVQRAFSSMGVVARRPGVGAATVWSLPASPAPRQA
jgi:RecA-family ATPase